MQIVIDIPEEDYERLKVYEKAPFCSLTSRVYEVIANGTPLPEHHSDLIERDALLDNVKNYGEGQSKLMLIDPYYVRRAETIIPATGNEFFNFDAPIIKKKTITKENSCKDCAHIDFSIYCVDCLNHANWIPKQTATKEGEEE